MKEDNVCFQLFLISCKSLGEKRMISLDQSYCIGLHISIRGSNCYFFTLHNFLSQSKKFPPKKKRNTVPSAKVCMQMQLRQPIETAAFSSVFSSDRRKRPSNSTSLRSPERKRQKRKNSTFLSFGFHQIKRVTLQTLVDYLSSHKLIYMFFF